MHKKCVPDFPLPARGAWAQVYMCGIISLMIICPCEDFHAICPKLLSPVWEKPYSYDNMIAPLRGKEDMHGPKHYTISFSWYGYWYIHDSPIQAEHWGDLSSHKCLPTIHSFAPSIIYLIPSNVPFLISTSGHKTSVSSTCTQVGVSPGCYPTFQLHKLHVCAW